MSKKRIVVTFLMVLCLAVMPVFQAYAADANDGIMPAMEYINSADYDLYIDNCVADIYVSVSGYPTVTKCEIEVTLQQKGLIFWSDYDSWTLTENSRSADLYETTTVNENKNYRIVAEITVWSGSQSETRTLTSDTVRS